MKIIPAAILLLLLTSCSSNTRYRLHDDQIPSNPPNLDHIENPQPRYEPYSIKGNRDYTMNGIDYEIVQDADVYAEKGIASWYGQKFHGHLTSNGEIYDMYSMSAAHKTLPIPSYVEVKNTDNGKTIIVRVNDRGPFHADRIIDLSYVAASKLDIIATGTGPVEIRLIRVAKPKDDLEWQNLAKQHYFVQLVATTDQQKAIQQAEYFTEQFELPTNIVKNDNIYRIRLGPFYDNIQTQKAQKQAHEYQINGAFIVIEPTDTEPNTQ